jgi:hypothetical protein
VALNRQERARALLDKLRVYIQKRLDEPGEVSAVVVEMFITWDQLNHVIESDPSPATELSPRVERLLGELDAAFDDMISIASDLEKSFPPELLKKIITDRYRSH